MPRTLRVLVSVASLAAAGAPARALASADDECPQYDVVVDASSAEIVKKPELAAWAREALGPRFVDGGNCFLFVAVMSANNATGAYLSLRGTSAQGERVVLAETQTISTGATAYRRQKLRRVIGEFVAEKAPRPKAGEAH